MSKLDDIIDEAGNVIDSYSCYTSAERPEIKQQIKSLMLELVGEDECICSEQSVKDCDALWHYVSDLRYAINAL